MGTRSTLHITREDAVKRLLELAYELGDMEHEQLTQMLEVLYPLNNFTVVTEYNDENKPHFAD